MYRKEIKVEKRHILKYSLCSTFISACFRLNLRNIKNGLINSAIPINKKEYCKLLLLQLVKLNQLLLQGQIPYGFVIYYNS